MIGPFNRPPAFFGVRFRFRPWSPDDDDEQENNEEDAKEDGGGNQAEAVPAIVPEPGGESSLQEENTGNFVTVRFELYEADPSQMWIEVATNYFVREPIMLDDLALVEKNIMHTFQFATENCKKFLDQFDPPVTDTTGG
jgi:hypothetical protein